ncbi:aldo/keto reductase [Paraflavitalea pollutisoli]|uniref:aldo/keto reductase n=1 Tax=Paraflavitalea pollutisoli TaxID=3034143 RepID=UPI0023EAAD13|nr:aldo/keto reductase [Paraflavitalea sp. H1-2-19X]
MEYRQLGETDLQLSAITFGAWAIGGWMWGGADRKEAVKAIQASYAAGVTSIDTAPAYGQGLSEEIVAEAIQGIPRDKVQLLTKFGLRWDVQEGEFFFKSKDNAGNDFDMYKLASKAGVIKECEDCLRRLKTDYIDLFQIHWADGTTPISETMEALALLQQQGKIRAAGVCNYSLAQMKEAAQTISLASDQVPYSMVLRDVEKELVPYMLEEKKSIIAYSPLQRGLLTGKIKPGYQFGEGDTREGNRFYTEESIVKVNTFLDTLKPLAASKQASLSQLVIRWTIEQRGITVALVGARNAEQAIQNAQAIDVKLSKEEIAFINQQIATLL